MAQSILVSVTAMPEGMHVLDRLRDEGRLADDQYQSAITHARTSGARLEDALVQVGAISEHDLLTRMASWYGTQFVGTERLARATVDPHALQLVPKRLAERLRICPVLWNARSRTLAVVAIDPTRDDVAKQVQMVAADLRKVTVLVARPAAIEASIRKHYDRDPRAFALLLRSAGTPSPGFDGNGMGGGGFGDLPGFGDSDAGGGFGGGGFGGGGFGGGGFGGAGDGFGGAGGFGGGGFDGAMDFGGGGLDVGFGDLGAPKPAQRPSVPKPAPTPSITIDAPDIAADLRKPPSSPPAVAPTPRQSVLPPPTREVPTTVPEKMYFETLAVLVALLERERGELRGHSARVARLARKMGERVGLAQDALFALTLAAHVHDLGKTGSYHLTPLNVARYEGHRHQAQKAYLTPVRLFEAASLPKDTFSALRHLYERWDGKGFPDEMHGKEIPMGARILAVVETFLDLTSHAKNPYRRQLTPAEACSVVEGLSKELFDPTLAAVLKQVVSGDALRQRLLADRRTVLLVDPDPEETAVLDMRFGAAGFEVVVAREASEAMAMLGGESSVDLVVTEVDLGERDGFTLLEKMRSADHTMPVVFLTRRSEGASVDRGFELGAADYVVKPASPDVVVAKARQILSRAQEPTASRGVSGSLTEMSLPDVIQILSNGRKTGRLTLRSAGKTGEISFGDGAIWDARFGGLEGESAFYALVALQAGDFRLDPAHVPKERKIQHSTESLLLEGMRRLDEAGR